MQESHISGAGLSNQTRARQPRSPGKEDALTQLFWRKWRKISLVLRKRNCRTTALKRSENSKIQPDWLQLSLRKQPTFGDATNVFLAKWHLRNERRNSILMTRHYPDLGGDSDWLNRISHLTRPIRITAQIWLVTRHQSGISALVSQKSFGGENSGRVAKCRLFSQANYNCYFTNIG